jgi:hypothetical protein
MGVTAAILGIVIAIALIFTGINGWWRLALFIPFWIGALGFFQRLEKTWVILAARGSRNLDNGEKKIEDETLIARLRRQARKVHVQSILTALLLTAAFLLIRV